MSRFSVCALMFMGLALSLAAPRPALAAEGYDNCTGFITTLPTAISTQGTWCLNQDLATPITSGSAISINTNNVTIDCNNFKIDGAAAGLNTSTSGIAAANRFNETIRNCNIRGFMHGVYLNGSSGGGHLVEDSLFDGNTWVGVWVEGDGSVVRRNRVFNSGGSTAIPNAYGIAAYYAVDVRDNIVSGVMARPGGNGFVIGIFTNSNPRGRITGNGVRGLVPDGVGGITGIYNNLSDRIAVFDNDVVGNGSAGSLGVGCDGANGSARDNVISGFVTNLSCTDSGGNDISP